MGIQGFNTWFSQNNTKAYIPLNTIKVDHIYVDMNSILHLVIRLARNMHHFHVLLHTKLDDLITRTHPKKSVFLALDGPAPLAKLMTQRERRKKIQLTPAQEKGKVVSALGLTPGTPFMQEIQESLSYYICKRLMNQKWKHLCMELSGSTVQGEGECKILSRLNSPLDHVMEGDTHVIVGNDSDLLLMALFCETKNLMVFATILEKMYISKKEKLKVFSVNKMNNIMKERGPVLAKNSQYNVNNLIKGLKRDMVIIAILTKGNDYLPGIKGASLEASHSGFWKVYLDLRRNDLYRNRTLTNETEEGSLKLDEPFLKILIEAAKNREAYNRGPMPTPAYQSPPDPEKYLEGLCWMLNMYSKGICLDYRFVYDAVSPSVGEIHKTIENRLNQKIVTERKEENKIVFPLKPAACALALLPRHGYEFAPITVRHLMKQGSPIQDIYHDCQICEEISRKLNRVRIKLENIGKEKNIILYEMERLNPESNDMRVKENRLEKLSAESQTIKNRLKRIEVERLEHLERFHPYEPFPVKRIEDALSRIPIRNVHEKDKIFFKFGKNFIYKRVRQQEQQQEEEQQKSLKDTTNNNNIVNNNGNNAPFGLMRPPLPPSNKFEKLQTPLPILRFEESFNN